MTKENINPYQRFTQKELILRDHLAVDRTVLANERTFLAYLRTALAFFLSGVTFIKFFGHLLVEILGWLFIPLGIIFFVVGLIRYIKMYRVISPLYQSQNDNHVNADDIFPLNNI